MWIEQSPVEHEQPERAWPSFANFSLRAFSRAPAARSNSFCSSHCSEWIAAAMFSNSALLSLATGAGAGAAVGVLACVRRARDAAAAIQYALLGIPIPHRSANNVAQFLDCHPCTRATAHSGAVGKTRLAPVFADRQIAQNPLAQLAAAAAAIGHPNRGAALLHAKTPPQTSPCGPATRERWPCLQRRTAGSECLARCRRGQGVANAPHKRSSIRGPA